MAYTINSSGTAVRYVVDYGDSLPLRFKIQKADGTFETLGAVTFTVETPTPVVVSLTVDGDTASGSLDTSSLPAVTKTTILRCSFRDPDLDVQLRGTITLKP